MSQYKATDDSIFALGANGAGSVIQSKVPKHGADEIRIARLGKDGTLVLKDKTGGVLEAAFGRNTYRWNGKTPLTNMLQKYSFANRGFTGGQTDTGSKTTHRNISVSGSDDWVPVAQGSSRGAPKAEVAPQMSKLQMQLSKLQKEMAALSSPDGKAKGKSPAGKVASKGKGKSPAGKVASKGKSPAGKVASKAKGKSPASAAKGNKGKGKAKAKSSPLSLHVTANDRDELEDKLRTMLKQLEDGRSKKRSASASASASASPHKKVKTSPPKAKSPVVVAAAAALEEGEIGEALELLQTVPEPVVQDLTQNETLENFTAGKSVVAAHYTKVTEDMPDAKMTVKELRQDLIRNMYDEAQLRELADGAAIQHARITKIQTLRDRLTEHFSDLLPEAECE